MDGILIFDTKNDLIYSKLNKEFISELISFVYEQNLLNEQSKRKIKKIFKKKENHQLDNVLILTFAPWITSLRILEHNLHVNHSFSEYNTNIKSVYTEV